MVENYHGLNPMKKRHSLPTRPSHFETFIAWLGCFLGISTIALLAQIQELDQQGSLFLTGSFGATAVLIFGLPDSPYAQPRNVLGGQIIAALIGVTIHKIMPDIVWLASALAVSTTVVGMHYFRMIHPPGGATALIAVIGGSKVHGLGYAFVFTPVLTGAVLMIVMAIALNNLRPNRPRYPHYW
ncbi:MAG: HPP family protein [Gammaproteobacteria bacterium]|nr:HPP family protein [Gammaproteobacteria bacterium]